MLPTMRCGGKGSVQSLESNWAEIAGADFDSAGLDWLDGTSASMAVETSKSRVKLLPVLGLVYSILSTTVSISKPQARNRLRPKSSRSISFGYASEPVPALRDGSRRNDTSFAAALLLIYAIRRGAIAAQA